MTRENKNLLLISANFPPVSTSGVHRMIRIVRYLHEMGVRITVLTADEKTLAKSFKYDDGLLEKLPPDIEIIRVPAFQGIKRLLDLKNRVRASNGAPQTGKVTKAPNRPSPSGKKQKSLLRRTFDAITLNLNSPDNYAMWIVPAIRDGRRLIAERGIRNILSSSPPGSAHVVAYYLKKQTGVHWIADFRDPWAKKEWRNPEMTAFKRRVNVRYEAKTLRSADRIIMNTPEMLEIYLQAMPELAQRAEVVPNGYDPADYQMLPSPPSRNGGPFCLLHTGTLYRGRSPVPFLRAWGEAVRSGRMPTSAMLVKFIGSVSNFAAEIEALSREYGLGDWIELVPPVPHRQCLVEMTRADALLLLQPGTRIQIPAKIYEYIAVRKPIFAISPPGVISRMMREYNLGWWADADDINQIREALIGMAQFFESPQSPWPINESVLEAFDGRRLVQQIGALLV